jgi:hypothetical protein
MVLAAVEKAVATNMAAGIAVLAAMVEGPMTAMRANRKPLLLKLLRKHRPQHKLNLTDKHKLTHNLQEMRRLQEMLRPKLLLTQNLRKTQETLRPLTPRANLYQKRLLVYLQ